MKQQLRVIHGCNPDMVEWYYELLIHRNLKTTYGNFELEVTTDMGFPQGGVCSAKFWIIAFDEAAKFLTPMGSPENSLQMTEMD